MSRGHNRSHKFKGPVFKSFLNATPGAPKQEFLPHTRYRAATRNLKRMCVHVFQLTDELSIAARKRCIESVAGEPFPEYAAYHLMYAAWEAHDGTGVPWHDTMTYLLDKFDAEVADRHITSSTQAIIKETDNECEIDTRSSQVDHEQNQLATEG